MAVSAVWRLFSLLAPWHWNQGAHQSTQAVPPARRDARMGTGLAAKKKSLLHIDAIQAFGKLSARSGGHAGRFCLLVLFVFFREIRGSNIQRLDIQAGRAHSLSQQIRKSVGPKLPLRFAPESTSPTPDPQTRPRAKAGRSSPFFKAILLILSSSPTPCISARTYPTVNTPFPLFF